MNTHNVCLYGETRKNISTFRLKKKTKKKPSLSGTMNIFLIS